MYLRAEFVSRLAACKTPSTLVVLDAAFDFFKVRTWWIGIDYATNVLWTVWCTHGKNERHAVDGRAPNKTNRFRSGCRFPRRRLFCAPVCFGAGG